MRMMGPSLLLAAALLSPQVQAAKSARAHGAQVTAAPALVPPADIADAFHEALRTRDRAKIAALMAPDAILFETGYAELTRDDYLKNHLGDDVDFSSVTDYQVIRRSVFMDGQSAWVLTQARIRGMYADQGVDLDQTETMILRRKPDGWEIVHLHWSAHPRQAMDPPSPAPAESGASPTAATPAPDSSEANPEDAKTP